MMQSDRLTQLAAENAHLIALLEANGILWRQPAQMAESTDLRLSVSTPKPLHLSTNDKVTLFRRLFRGRTDVYPIRWESKNTAKTGYSPACANEWRVGVCEKPRVIGCAESYPQHIALPRGCLDDAQKLLADNNIRCELVDERFEGAQIGVNFVGTLRVDQEVVVAAMLQHDTGVLSAPTAFGKTVVASAMIARRGVNTLILVHRTELLKQWQARLPAFLEISRKDMIGSIGGGRSKPQAK